MYMLLRRRVSRAMGAGLLALVVLLTGGGVLAGRALVRNAAAATAEKAPAFIKWVEYNVSYEAMDRALSLDIASYGQAVHVDWITLLACAAARNGGNFKGFSVSRLNALAEQLKAGKSLEELTKDLTYYAYYEEAYRAVLGGFVGEYEREIKDENAPGGKRWEKTYGLKAFSPIAKNYPYGDFDDFGSSRSYGFRRRHLGHDFMGATGTPVIAVEGGVVEALGWNQYGGWRIGIRSYDKKRYYYYAHLRQNFPYNKALKEGSVVQPGDVIGYLGHTGYSTKENVNNIDEPHLHFGMQLIFDESQKESNSEIWIDVYAISRLLYCHRSEVVKDPATKEYHRVYGYRDRMGTSSGTVITTVPTTSQTTAATTAHATMSSAAVTAASSRAKGP